MNITVYAKLEDLGTPRLGELLAEDLAMSVQQQIERALTEKVLDMRRNGCDHVYIVRWQEWEANVFRWSGQIFGPGEEQAATALAAEKQGKTEVLTFKEANNASPSV